MRALPQKDMDMSIEEFIANEVKSNDVVLFMVQTPSQRGRIQLALKTLIYQAMGR